MKRTRTKTTREMTTTWVISTTWKQKTIIFTTALISIAIITTAVLLIIVSPHRQQRGTQDPASAYRKSDTWFLSWSLSSQPSPCGLSCSCEVVMNAAFLLSVDDWIEQFIYAVEIRRIFHRTQFLVLINLQSFLFAPSLSIFLLFIIVFILCRLFHLLFPFLQYSTIVAEWIVHSRLDSYF